MNKTPQVFSSQIDVNDPNFYNNSEDVINDDIANLKKSLTKDLNLRILAAEMEVETAALYLHLHWSNLEEFKLLVERKAEYDDMLKKILSSLNERLVE